MSEETKGFNESDGTHIPEVTLKKEGKKWVARNAQGKVESRRDRKRDVLRAMKARGWRVKEGTLTEQTNGVA